MARENTVYLYGRLIADPKNRMDKENNPISSRMILQTLRRSYANDEMILQGKIIPDTPIVISRNCLRLEPDYIRKSMGSLQ